MKNSSTENIIDLLERTLPPCLPRKNVSALTYGMLNSRTMANLDCDNKGPKGAYRVGREVWYIKEDLIEFIKSKITDGLN